jgi:uncharacterized membrane protein YoaK (UPF0700 family)
VQANSQRYVDAVKLLLAAGARVELSRADQPLSWDTVLAVGEARAWEHQAVAVYGERSSLVSRSSASHQERLATGLAMLAGFVDAYGIISYNTYLSFMSGNTTQTAYRTGEGDFAQAVPSALAIMFFAGGSFVGALIANSGASQPRRLAFGVVAASLALVIGLTQLGFWSDGVKIALATWAMGILNTTLSRVGSLQVNVTFVTGTLSRLGVQLALAVKGAALRDSQGSWDTHMHRVRVLLGIWAAFLGGALLSGAATPRFGAWVLLFPILILSTLAASARIHVVD